MKEEKKIGRFRLGPHSVDLYVSPYMGGSFDSASKRDGVAVMRVGLDCADWGECVSILLHEALEFAMMDTRTRWRPAPDYANDGGDYLFVMKHHEFSEAAARAGCFISDCLPALSDAYKKFVDKRKKKKCN